MSTLDWVTFAVAAIAFIGCLFRIFAVSWRTHRPAIVGGLFLCAGASILIASRATQGDANVLGALACTAVLMWLVATLRDWRDGRAPESARRRA